LDGIVRDQSAVLALGATMRTMTRRLRLSIPLPRVFNSRTIDLQ